MATMRLSILDDYQGVALDMADWSPVRRRGIEIAVERFPFADEDDGRALARRLARSSARCASARRSRSSVVDRLPEAEAADHHRHAQCLVRHGGAEGARRHRLRHRRPRRRQRGHCRARLGPDPRRRAAHRRGSSVHAPRRLADPHRPPRRRQDHRLAWASAGSAARSPGSASPSA